MDPYRQRQISQSDCEIGSNCGKNDITSAGTQKTDLSKFPCVFFGEISYCFILVGAGFFRGICKTGFFFFFFFFCSGKRHKFAQIEKHAFTNPAIYLFKIRIPQIAICCENFGRFQRRNSRLSQIKPSIGKKKNPTFVWACIIQD